jgi:hypothetical protein
MTAAKRSLIKLAVIGTLFTGALAMPVVASAAPNTESGNATCYGYAFTAGYAQEGITPPVKADFFGYNNAGEFNHSLQELCGLGR